ncbi:hypothetical protein E6C67_04190 (plasmid) [Azospirillum sp. TSA2s]|uniref:hypothetical protein n=1 Tax=Azospirillum sp. TSA2s TaxID=709810 RepID=UPI0010AA72FF|nr:hypothetical protein [Azospirillum sp. TSA2s]QCG93146.1 hypothetical protein E6C67_04190 [Azospirillum sp. TSA2s]
MNRGYKTCPSCGATYTDKASHRGTKALAVSMIAFFAFLFFVGTFFEVKDESAYKALGWAVFSLAVSIIFFKVGNTASQPRWERRM